MRLIQFFDNERDVEAQKSVSRIEEAGYTVHFLPASGPAVLSIEDYEVIGGPAIHSMADQLVEEHWAQARDTD